MRSPFRFKKPCRILRIGAPGVAIFLSYIFLSNCRMDHHYFGVASGLSIFSFIARNSGIAERG
jgi:hypothetical protein